MVDLQLVSVMVNVGVGLVVPAAAWIFKLAIQARLDDLARQVALLQDRFGALDRAAAVVVDSHVPERLGRLEERVARLEGSK